MALFGLTGAALSSLRAGLIDRYGPRRALPPKSPALLSTATALGRSRRPVELPAGGLLSETGVVPEGSGRP
ncbi:hypothetical protein [Streptosporangium sp. NPDC002607]